MAMLFRDFISSRQTSAATVLSKSSPYAFVILHKVYMQFYEISRLILQMSIWSIWIASHCWQIRKVHSNFPRNLQKYGSLTCVQVRGDQLMAIIQDQSWDNACQIQIQQTLQRSLENQREI